MSDELLVDEMSVDEMEKWLLGDSDQAVEWRQDPANAKTVGALTERFASTPGGRARRVVVNHLRSERERLEREANAEAEEQARMERLYEVAKADWLANGGIEAEFEKEWKSLRKELLRSGRAEELLEQGEAERRRKAARTF